MPSNQSLDDRIARLVAAAPELTPRRRAQLRELLSPFAEPAPAQNVERVRRRLDAA